VLSPALPTNKSSERINASGIGALAVGDGAKAYYHAVFDIGLFSGPGQFGFTGFRFVKFIVVGSSPQLYERYVHDNPRNPLCGRVWPKPEGEAFVKI
jgi:hypothetical protein